MTQTGAMDAGAGSRRLVRYHERRSEERYELNGIEGTLRYDSCEMRCSFMDVSLNGCCVRTEVQFEAGALASVEVTMPLLGMQVELRGTTQWVGSNRLVGIRLDHASPRTKNEFASLLTGLMDKSAAEVVKEVVTSTGHGQINVLALSKGMVLLPKASHALDEQSAKPRKGKNKTENEQDSEALRAEQRRLKEMALQPDPAPDSTNDEAQPQARKTVFVLSEVQTQQPDERKESAPQSGDQPDHSIASSAPTAKGTGRRVQNDSLEEWSASVTCLTSNAHAKGVLVDLGLAGCTFMAHGVYPGGLGSRVEVEFHLQGLPFRIAGITETDPEDQTATICFSEMTRRRREELIQVLDELAEQNKNKSRKG